MGGDGVVTTSGGPGVGKGTFARRLKADMNYSHISTGQQIRKILNGKGGTKYDEKLIETIREVVESGGLVSDSIVVDIIH